MASSRSKILIGALLILTVALAFGLRTYWNADAAVGPDGNYTLSGNDPYYHKRAIDHITETWSTLEHDGMLNYPEGSVNPNPPLYQWSAAVGAKAMEPIAGDLDTATWWSVLSAPAVWGTLTLIPVFLIGRMFAGSWGGLLAAFLVATSPEHMSRTSLGFSDHDAAVIFLAASGFYFFLRSLDRMGSRKRYTAASDTLGAFGSWFTQDRRAAGSAVLAGGFFGALSLVWKGFPYVYGVILAYAGIQFLINHWKGLDVARPTFAMVTTLGIASLMGLPYYSSLGLMNFWNPALFLFLALATLGLYFLATQDYPSVLVVPGLLLVAGVFLVIMFLVVPEVAKALLYRFVYFKQTILYTTIAEAHPADFATLAFAVGPMPFFLYISGFGFLLYRVWNHDRPSDLGFLTWASVDLFLSLSAVRFISQSVPTMALLAAMATIWFLELMNLPNVLERYQKSGFRSVTRVMGTGGWGGVLGFILLAGLAVFLGYGVVAVLLLIGVGLFLLNASLGLTTGSNLMHVTAVLFVGALVIVPGAVLATDAAVPSGLENRKAREAQQDAFEDVTAKGKELGLTQESIQEFQAIVNNSRSAKEFRSNLQDAQLRLGLQSSTINAIYDAGKDEMDTVGIFAKRLGAFGQSFLPPGWHDTLTDLSTRDTEELPPDRPAFLAWWDYGHWAIYIGEHPSVADNFQNGYEMAGSFLAAQNESHAVQLMAARQAKIFTQEEFTSILNDHGLDDFDAERYYKDFRRDRFPHIQFHEDPDENLATSVAWLEDVEAAKGKLIRYVAADNRMMPLDDPSTRNVESPSIFYAPVTLARKDPEQFVEQVLVDMDTGQRMSQAEIREIQRNPNVQQPNIGQRLLYHEAFFNSMYYRSYMGLPVFEPIQQQGQTFPRPFNLDNFPSFYQNPQMMRSQSDTITGAALTREVAPGFGLEHFRLIHANPAVRMLEYYPGAFVEGTVTMAGEPQEGLRVTVFDDAGEAVRAISPSYYDRQGRSAADLDVPHDSVLTDGNGTFRLVAPFSTDRGVRLKVTQEIASGPQQGAPPVLATATLEITREQSNERSTITQDISIEPATLTGTAFLDANGNGTQDADEDTLEGVNVTVQGKTVTTDADGRFTIEDLAPGQHPIQTDLPGYQLAAQARQVTLVSGEVVEKNLTMEHEPVQVTGEVATSDGREIEGIEIQLTPTEDSKTGQPANQFSQVNGTVSLSLQPGTYTVSGNGTDLETNQTMAVDTVEVEAGTGASIDEAGNLVIQPGAEGVRLAITVAPR